VPETATIQEVLQAMVEAMEAKEAAEPDLPEWEANKRLRAAEENLLRMYRESGRSSSGLVAIDIAPESPALAASVEVA
jgi:hypothetical protein